MLIKCHFFAICQRLNFAYNTLEKLQFFSESQCHGSQCIFISLFSIFFTNCQFLVEFYLKSRNNLLISKLILRMQKFTKQVYNFFLECNDWLVLFTKIKKYNRYEMAGYFCWGLNLGPSAWQAIVLTITPWGCKKDSWNHSSK